ncbi:tRNA methyltransferase RSM22 [Aspergillus homomorphus CBS 101889]|uniref:37S ribosomal protein Rsm22 n=1 Tax=Aspergillus homomorphus (strain CBS 101889) TaxID=1450537 RepID=A0A395HS64_ASPHC|nr:hypothetical protein BO97DRAFT_436151 [Aspergillus homomorphus CBS 101889]RAL10329.1 hypothetical protein BO97DRAFT_436151 [Aspergillus homomorphus CBS 101889]
MATWAYPPLPPGRLEQEVESTLAKELEWLLCSLQDSLVSLREGLHECAALLAPKEPGSTLVLSSLRSENVKGYVTRVGTKIVKGDIQLRLNSLASTRGSSNTRLCLSNAPEAPELVLDQLVSVRDLVNQSLDIVDVSTWTGDPLNASFIFSQLHLLRETITEARQMLKGENDKVKQKWWEASAGENMFDPPLPPCLSFHLTIADSALVLHLRTLESSTPTHTPTAFASDISLTGFNIRDRLFGTRHRPHDEAGDVFTWKGDEVKVKEKVRSLRGAHWAFGSRYSSSSATSAVPDAVHAERKDVIYALIDEINENEAAMADIMEDLDLLDDFEQALNLDALDYDHAFSQTIGHRDQETLEARVRMAKQEFRQFLPPDYLNEREIQLYTRLYGEPVYRDMATIQPDADLAAAEEAEEGVDQLYREDGQGGWEKVELVEAEEYDEELEEEGLPVVFDMEAEPELEETIAMQRTREVAEQLGGEIMVEQFESQAFPEEDDSSRFHPATELGKSGTMPSTVFLPQDTLVKPISMILSDFSNQHLRQVARRVFQGRHLPLSVSTPPRAAQAPQLPSPLKATQRHMTEMESNVYLAAMYPGLYASVLSVLVEVRKRLGTEWLRNLLSKEEGPSVLDASAGGAGIIAWRDIMRAEWEAMDPGRPVSEVPLGKSTVVVASSSLRARASALLQNTTFLPRLPDYVHSREAPTLDDDRAPKRKHFDIEEYMRKEHVQNLWQMGHQRGFEAIAGARDMLLKRIIRNTDLATSSEQETTTEETTAEEDVEDEAEIEKETGMIIAPCTNHAQCPMYRIPGHAVGRGDWCHFRQRYIRPAFLQNILEAKTRNHEDLNYSYLAVQRGNRVAKHKAMKGYEHLWPDDETRASMTDIEQKQTAEQEAKFESLTLPRIIYSPMKRRGHVTFDVCTPDAQIERWTVPRSFSRQAYRDVRKSRWGDLWALGSKTQLERKLEARAAAREAAKEAQEEEDENAAAQSRQPELVIPKRKKGEKIPGWKKHQDKKKVRQHYNQTRHAQSDASDFVV